MVRGVATAGFWSVRRRGNILEVGYGSGAHFPQYAALHTDSAFLRLNYGPTSGWGTSIVLLPSFWLAGQYHQGAALEVDCRVKRRDLVLTFTAAISKVQVRGVLLIAPPARGMISAIVTVGMRGRIEPDDRPGEAFKLVILTSMHVSPRVWDVDFVQIESRSFPMPASGWIVRPPVLGHRLIAYGGSTSWKRNALTLELALAGCYAMTGWLTPTSDCGDDNVAIWAASDGVVDSWAYTVTARR